MNKTTKYQCFSPAEISRGKIEVAHGKLGQSLVIPQILRHHFEDFQFLWGQHQRALRSPDYKSRDLQWLEERIAANVDGLLVAGEEAMPLLEEALASDETGVSFAAALTLLRIDPPRTERVMTVLLEAKGKQLDGIRQALCHSPIDKCISQLQTVLTTSPAPIALAAAEILAFHRKLERPPSRLTELLKDENPSVRQSAWRIMALLGSTPTA